MFSFKIQKHLFLQGLIISAFLYFFIFRFFVFTLSSKDPSTSPDFYFLGSFLSQYDIERVIAGIPQLESTPPYTNIVQIPSSKIPNDKNHATINTKPLLQKYLNLSLRKKNPQAFFKILHEEAQPYIKEEGSPVETAVEGHIPLKLPHEHLY